MLQVRLTTTCHNVTGNKAAQPQLELIGADELDSAFYLSIYFISIPLVMWLSQETKVKGFISELLLLLPPQRHPSLEV